MNGEDYAVIIGINRYPRFARHEPPAQRDLMGPDRDATDIYKWLHDLHGGALPVDQQDGGPFLKDEDGNPLPKGRNSWLIRSSDFVSTGKPSQERPAEAQIIDAFDELRQRPRRGDGRIGRRLYVYVGGHGFGIDRCDGALYTAEASPDLPQHIYIAKYFQWFRRTALFEEYVLWFDACATALRLKPDPRPVAFPPQIATDEGMGLVFAAYAAKHTLRAIERAMPADGRVHGAFTHALLLGLKGAAAVPGMGVITTNRLKGYLNETMRQHMDRADLVDDNVSKTPDFFPDDDFHLVTLPQQAEPETRLQLPAGLAEGSFDIISGALTRLLTAKAANGVLRLSLPPGFYKALAQGSGKSFLFEITGGGDGKVR